MDNTRPPESIPSTFDSVKDEVSALRDELTMIGKSVGNIGTSLGNVGTALGAVITSEIQLAKEEIKHTGSRFTAKAIRIAVFGAFAALGILPLIAFLVIGLGRILNDNYWLSALIVSIAMFAIGGIVAYRTYLAMTREDFTLPETREALGRDARVLQEKVREISNVTRLKQRGTA